MVVPSWEAPPGDASMMGGVVGIVVVVIVVGSPTDITWILAMAMGDSKRGWHLWVFVFIGASLFC